jgi:hypothetical protein
MIGLLAAGADGTSKVSRKARNAAAPWTVSADKREIAGAFVAHYRWMIQRIVVELRYRKKSESASIISVVFSPSKA